MPAPVRAVSRQVVDSASLPADLFHDLGNVVASLQLGAHVVAGSSAPAEIRALGRELGGLSAEVGSMLTLLRALVGVRRTTRVVVAPAELLEALRRTLRESPPSRAEVRVTRRHRLPDVRVDPGLFHHLLVALTLRAIDASGPRGRVRISGHDGGSHVGIVLEDHAEPLVLVDDRGKPMRGGRALVVRLAAELLRRAGGGLSLEHRRNGNRLELRLPACRDRARGLRRRA